MSGAPTEALDPVLAIVLGLALMAVLYFQLLRERRPR